MVILLGYLESLFICGQDAFYLKLIDICTQKIEPNLEGSLFEFCQLKSTSDFSNFTCADSRVGNCVDVFIFAFNLTKHFYPLENTISNSSAKAGMILPSLFATKLK